MPKNPCLKRYININQTEKKGKGVFSGRNPSWPGEHIHDWKRYKYRKKAV